MNEGINAFLLHYKEDAATSSFSGDFLLQTPTQSPAQYLRMMKTIWIIQRVLECSEYKEACRNGNRLLRCFVDGLAQKSLDEFNRFADGPRGNPYKVRNEPSEEDLSPLGKDAFAIWPKPVRQPDSFDIASMDSLKIVLRAALQLPPTPYLAPTSSRHKELLLLRHNSTLLEMVVRETWQADQSSNSQSYVFTLVEHSYAIPRIQTNLSFRKIVDLKTVSLNPIYADPNNQSPNIDLCLNTMGNHQNRGPDDQLPFRAYPGRSSFLSNSLVGSNDSEMHAKL